MFKILKITNSHDDHMSVFMQQKMNVCTYIKIHNILLESFHVKTTSHSILTFEITIKLSIVILLNDI